MPCIIFALATLLLPTRTAGLLCLVHSPLSSKHSGKQDAGLNTFNDRPKPCKESVRGRARNWAAVNLSSLETFVAHQFQAFASCLPRATRLRRNTSTGLEERERERQRLGGLPSGPQPRRKKDRDSDAYCLGVASVFTVGLHTGQGEFSFARIPSERKTQTHQCACVRRGGLAGSSFG